MSKRFRDTELWMKEWFMKLSPYEKLAIQYIFDSCDYAGMWTPNFTLAEALIGGKVSWDALLEKVNGNIELQPSGKWWLVDFCEFQYIKLTASCPPHRKAIALLEKYGLWERVAEGYMKGCKTLQEEEEEEEDEEDKGKEEDKKKEPSIFFNFELKLWENIPDELVARWQDTFPATNVERQLKLMAEWLLADPKRKKKNYRRFIVSWLERAQDKGRP